MAETRRYHVVPISPLFLGTGNSLGPEEYYIDRDHLVRFSTANTIAAMTANERNQLEMQMDGASILDGVTLLRQVARRESAKTTLYRLPAGESFRERLASLNRDSDQAIQTMSHAGDSGHGVLPGTALKGAIRTALLSQWLAEDPGKQSSYRADIQRNQRPGINVDSRKLEADVLGGEFDSDPFRYLAVRDVTVSVEQMQVDSFQMVGRDGSPKGGGSKGKGVAIFGERVRSFIDGNPIIGKPLEIEYKGGPFLFPRAGRVEISIETEKRKDPRVKELFKGAKEITFKQQMLACRTFYSGRLRAERERFPELYRWLTETLADLFANTGTLLRIGRYSHFESASLDGIRMGWNVQKRQPIESGNSRTACPLANGDLAPMGWLWLVREEL